MPMKNLDLIKQQYRNNMQQLFTALQSNDADKAAEVAQQMQSDLMQGIEAEFEQYKNVTDMSVLQARGLRALTADETAWYQKFIDAHKSGAKQEITNLTAAMPFTIIDRVIEDMQREHPLLAEIAIQNVAGAVKFVLNGIQVASKLGTWGVIGSGITKELKGAIKVVDATVAKYTAYFLMPKDFTKFNFGFAPIWVDQYVRIVLSESCAFGLESTITAGDGDGQFVGMMMDTTTQQNGKYSKKAAVVLKDFGDSYAEVVAGLCEDEQGNYRTPAEVLLVVNPVDNVKKVRRLQNAIVPGVGVLDLISQTYPTKVVTCDTLAKGEAIAGIAKNYGAGINGGQSGVIEYSDEAQFLDDVRVYTTRIYGYGQPTDNKSFTRLDISGVQLPALPVSIQGTVATQEQTGE